MRSKSIEDPETSLCSPTFDACRSPPLCPHCLSVLLESHQMTTVASHIVHLNMNVVCNSVCVCVYHRIEHLSLNMAMQLLVGVPLEMVHGALRIGLVYVCGVLAGGTRTHNAPTTYPFMCSHGQTKSFSLHTFLSFLATQ